MGIFGGDIIPGCKVEQEESVEGRVILTCQPKKLKPNGDAEAYGTVRLSLERGSKAQILDDGGVPTGVLKRLMMWVEKRR